MKVYVLTKFDTARELEASIRAPNVLAFMEELKELFLTAPLVFASPQDAMLAAADDWQATMKDLIVEGLGIPDELANTMISPLLFTPTEEGHLEGKPIFPSPFDAVYRVTLVDTDTN